MLSTRTSIRSGSVNVFNRPPNNRIMILELEDVLFHFDSAVIMPCGPEGPSSTDGAGPRPEQLSASGILVLAAVLKYIAAHPCKRLLIVGHTDTRGGPAYNLSLSQLRGENALFLLLDRKIDWISNSISKYKTEDIQTILNYISLVWGWDCDPHGIDDHYGPRTTRAMRSFQERYNTEFSMSIPVTGTVNEETWGAFFDMYVRDLAVLAGTTVAGLALLRQNINLFDSVNPVLPCGEFLPVEAANRDNFRSQANRRVEFVFIDMSELSLINFPYRTVEEADLRRRYNFSDYSIYDTSLFDPEYINPWDLFTPEQINIEVKYLPAAVLQTPLTLKDNASGNEISDPADFLNQDWNVVFTDNHMLTRAHNNNMLGGGGVNISVPAFYRTRNWNQTSTPVLPLKLKITREDGTPIGVGSISLTAQLLVEQTETSSIVPNTERTLIESTFQRLEFIDAANPELNANNAPTNMAGIRPRNSFQSAENRFATFNGQNQNTAVIVTDLQDDDRIAVIPVPGSQIEVCEHEAIINILVYLPQQSGERYKIRFGILGQTGSVESQILTIWRRLRIELLINIGTALTAAIINDVIEAYKKFYIELTEPENTTTITQAQWRNITFAYFNAIHYPNAGNAAAYQYDVNLLPNIALNGATDGVRKREASRHAKALTLRYQTQGLTNAGYAVGSSPSGNVVVYGPPIHADPAATTAGFYLGDSLSAFFRVNNLTSTIVHEIGHGRFLRHSFTNPVPDVAYNGREIYKTSSARFWRDHHQLFAGGCTMSYTRNRSFYLFCAICQLILRFWDKVNLRPVVQDLLDDGWGNLVLAETDDYDAITGTLRISVGDTLELRLLAGPDNSGNVHFYKDVTDSGLITWNFSTAGVLHVDPGSGEIRGQAVGTTVVTARLGTTVSAGVTVRVT